MTAPAAAERAPALTVQEVHRLLTAPGSRFEMEEASIRGLLMRVWKHSPRTFTDVFRASLAFGDREFLILESQRVSYAAFGKAAAALARELVDRGIGKGDVVAIVMVNRPEWVVAWFAILLTGAIAAPLNPAAAQSEMEFMLQDSGACLALVEPARQSVLAQARETCPALRGLIVGPGPAKCEASWIAALDDLIGPWRTWSDLPPVQLPATEIHADDEAMLFYTSGTTGRPKGVLTTHRSNVYNIFHSAFRVARRCLLERLPLPESDPTLSPRHVNLVPVPLFHVSGSTSHVLVIMPRGGTIVFMKWWAAEFALRLIERERVNLMGGVPTVVLQVLEHPKLKSYNLSSLDQFAYGGGPSPPRLTDEITEAGFVPAQNWGMTETCGSVIGHVGSEFQRRPSSCGLPAPVNELRITHPQTGAVLDEGEAGELWIRGPQNMVRYWNNPQLTDEMMQEGWLRTGDIARLDNEGYCYIVDRAKDMLICAGENIYCTEIENALYHHPDVIEAAALGLPHPEFGEQPAAVVHLRPGAILSERSLRAFAGERLPPLKTPARILIRHEPLPRNDSGKLTKLGLGDLFAREYAWGQ